MVEGQEQVVDLDRLVQVYLGLELVAEHDRLVVRRIGAGVGGMQLVVGCGGLVQELEVVELTVGLPVVQRAGLIRR